MHWRWIQKLPSIATHWQLMKSAEEVCLLDANGDLNCPIPSFYRIFLLTKMGSYCLLISITLKCIWWKCSRCYLIFYHGSLSQSGKSVAILIHLLISVSISRIKLSFKWQPAHFVRWLTLCCILSSTDTRLYINTCSCESSNRNAWIILINKKSDGTSLKLGSPALIPPHG